MHLTLFWNHSHQASTPLKEAPAGVGGRDDSLKTDFCLPAIADDDFVFSFVDIFFFLSGTTAEIIWLKATK